MGASWRFSAACALLLLAASCAALPADGRYIDLTRYFTFSATSVCGDKPTLFEFPKNSGQFQNCSGSEYSEDHLFDGNPNTRWQSISGETPVTLSFTLNQPALSLRLKAIRMMASDGPPRYIYLEEQPAGEQNFTTLQVFVLNVTVDCEGIVDTCVGYTVEEFLPIGAVVLFCPGTFSEPVSEIRMRLVGFQDIFKNETSQYYSIPDVKMLGRLVPIALDLQLSRDSGVRVEVQSDGAQFIRVILRDAKHRRYKDIVVGSSGSVTFSGLPSGEARVRATALKQGPATDWQRIMVP